MLSSVLRLLGYALAGTVVLAWISTGNFVAFGGNPDVAQLTASPQFQGDRFVNPEPTSLMAASKWPGALKRWLFGKEMRAPTCPLPVATDTAARLGGKPG